MVHYENFRSCITFGVEETEKRNMNDLVSTMNRSPVEVQHGIEEASIRVSL